MFRIVFNFSALNYICNKTPPESIILVTTDNGSKNLELEGDIKKCLKKNKHRLFIILNPRVCSLYCFFNFRRIRIFTILGRKQAIKYQGGHWQRFPVPVFSIPIPVLRLSSLGTRFRLRFRDCPWLEHDSESNYETAQALNSIPVPRLHHRLRARFRVLPFRF